MKNRFVRYVLIVLLCGLCHTAAFAYGYNQHAQSKDWGYQPVYKSNSSMPSYQFRTTSAYISASGASEPYNPLFRPGGPRRATLWDEMTDDDDPMGVVPDPAPVGDTPWLLMLLLAAGYVAYRAKNRRKA